MTRGVELEHPRGEGRRGRDDAQPVEDRARRRRRRGRRGAARRVEPLAGAGVAAEHPAVLERGGVHRAGGGGGDAFDLDVVLLEQAVERAPGEGAVRAAALQREVDDRAAPRSRPSGEPGRARHGGRLAGGFGGSASDVPRRCAGTARRACIRGGEISRARRAQGKKRRPHKEGVKSLRQVSYRQETYRAVEPLYKIKGLPPSQKS